VVRRAYEIEQTIVTITMITSVVKTLRLTTFPPDRGQPDPRFADIETCPEPQDGVEALRVALTAHRGVRLHLIIRGRTRISRMHRRRVAVTGICQSRVPVDSFIQQNYSPEEWRQDVTFADRSSDARSGRHLLCTTNH
jgi:hypothetical protein